MKVMVPKKVRRHLEVYWARARNSFEYNDFPLAAFFAITLIEEVGKVILLGNAKLSGNLDRKTFRNHKTKYAYAVHATLLVNSRVTKIYDDLESRFARWFREGELFTIRNNALYLEMVDNHLRVAQESVRRDDSFLLVCIAGEVLADIQGRYLGTGPEQWSKLLKQVDQFRTAYEKASA